MMHASSEMHQSVGLNDQDRRKGHGDGISLDEIAGASGKVMLPTSATISKSMRKSMRERKGRVMFRTMDSQSGGLHSRIYDKGLHDLAAIPARNMRKGGNPLPW